jgi:serine/threonine protein kinase
MKLNDVLVDRYQIRQQLSRKAGRQTFLAQDLHSQSLVIIKILRFDADFHWDDLKLFEREAATLQHLDHPAIPKYLDYFEVEAANTRGFALVQTYIEAPSLESVVKAGRKFSEAEVVELADRMLSILTYLHEQIPPVIHRDIKPSNVLLTNRSGNSVGDLYLVDFGSVQTAASKDGGTITIVGSYGYMPLEQFGGQTTVASDLYSLGMTIIYILTGTHPAELPQANGQVQFTAEVSKQLHHWLGKMTQPHLSKRFSLASSAKAELKSPNYSYGDFLRLDPLRGEIEVYRDQDSFQFTRRTKPHLEMDLKTKEAVDSVFSQLIGCGFWVGNLVWIWYVLSSHSLGTVFAAIGNGLLASLFITFGVGAFQVYLVYPLVAICQYVFINLFEKYTTTVFPKDDVCVIRYLTRKDKNKLSITIASNVHSVIYNPGYTFHQYFDGDGALTTRGRVNIEPELSILFGSELYSIQEGFTKEQLYSLGQELSEFFDLELQVIYPTPRVPPEDPCNSCGD